MINRIIYLGYYFSRTSKEHFYRNFHFVKKKNHISSFALYRDILFSSLKYNVSFMDYFKLRFFDKTTWERAEYAGSGFMYEYQLRMNPKKYRNVLEDKIKFLTHFKDFSGRQWATLDMLMDTPGLSETFLENESGKVVLKNSRGQAGKEVMVIETKGITPNALQDLMTHHKFDLIEKFVIQHDVLMKIAPRALNTVRIITQLHDGKVSILGTSLRLSIHLNVDNISAGGVGAPIDPSTGVVVGPGLHIDITKDEVYTHPLTHIDIVGLSIPFWQECINIVTKAALLTPENKSIGWDVAITNNGPLLIEGNHNWNNDLWQMPIKKGMKKVLLEYMHN